jgi:hypothetical protein
MNTRALLALLLSAALTGCIGMVGNPASPDEKVASLTLNADALHALHAKECVDSTCALPNNRDCIRLVVDIYGDGRMEGYCTQEGGKVVRLTNPRDIPLQCRSDKEKYSVQCMDVRDNLAVDATQNQVHFYPSRVSAAYQRFIGAGIGDGSGYLLEDEGGDEGSDKGSGSSTTPPPSTNPTDVERCAKFAKDVFIKAFANALKQEGLNFGYTPSGVKSTSGFFNNSQYQSHPALLCEQTVKSPCDKQAAAQGRCYCWNGTFGATCKGAPMVDAALAEACGQMPPPCNPDTYATTVWDESREAINWIQNNNKTTTTKEGVATAGAITAGALAAAAGIGALIMLADPLILDLDGDGVALTSAAGGVVFDMTGAGPARTAWVSGSDDALLAIDLDGNGRIDNGGELFGDAFSLGGQRARDGFEALALADSPRNAGNGDGRVDPRDGLYDRLLLWRDGNRDGVSQAGELSSLSSAGIEALGTQQRTRSTTDRHGNDLSAQGSFLRAGQAGRMFDACLVNR